MQPVPPKITLEKKTYNIADENSIIGTVTTKATSASAAVRNFAEDEEVYDMTEQDIRDMLEQSRRSVVFYEAALELLRTDFPT